MWTVGERDGLWDNLREARVVMGEALGNFNAYLSSPLDEPPTKHLDPRNWSGALKRVFKSACHCAPRDTPVGEQSLSSWALSLYLTSSHTALAQGLAVPDQHTGAPPSCAERWPTLHSFTTFTCHLAHGPEVPANSVFYSVLSMSIASCFDLVQQAWVDEHLNMWLTGLRLRGFNQCM